MGLNLDKSLARINALTLGRIAKGNFQTNKRKLHDGGGLYIVFKPSGGSWCFKYQIARQVREMGLGSVAQVPAPQARELARIYRAMVKQGQDPLHHRTLERRERRAEERAARLTFREVADQVLADLENSSRAAKTKASWRQVLTAHAYPSLGSKALDDITNADIIDLLRPLWGSRRDAAQKTRIQIERVFDEAILRKLTTKANPARLVDLKAALAPFATSGPKNHHAAMPWRDVPALMTKLAADPNLSAAALRLTILSACRTREVLGARFDEFVDGIWSIPPSRMKTGQQHRVPISSGIAALIDEQRARQDGPLVVPLSPMAMSMRLKKMGITATVHGFRSSFRDFAAEHAFPREIAEMSLAHRVGNSVEQSYFRSDILDQRRALMQRWSDFCLQQSGTQKKLADIHSHENKGQH